MVLKVGPRETVVERNPLWVGKLWCVSQQSGLTQVVSLITLVA